MVPEEESSHKKQVLGWEEKYQYRHSLQICWGKLEISSLH